MDIIAHTDTNQTRNSDDNTTMLKWTVNKPGGANTNTQANRATATPSSPTMSIFVDREPPARRSLGASLQSHAARHRQQHGAGRKSLGSSAAATLAGGKMRLHSSSSNTNKENCIMLKPHLGITTAVRASPQTSSPAFGVGKSESAFREIGNLTPIASTAQTNASANMTPLRKPYLPPSPSPQRTNRSVSDVPVTPPTVLPLRPRNFAATLPTLDVEYSPACYVERSTSTTTMTTTTTATTSVHGITVQNTIFGTARYFNAAQELPKSASSAIAAAKKPRLTAELTPLAFQLSKLRFSQVSLQQCGLLADDENDDEATMQVSSKSMDDSELERMIDEILESTRKVRKLPRLSQNVQLQPACPVTTTTRTLETVSPASPSSDSAANRTIITMTGDVEREIRTPDSTFNDVANETPNASAEEQCQLRRQRVVRRKHTVKTNSKTYNAAVDRLQREDIEKLACMETPKATISTAGISNSITTTTPPDGLIDADDVQGSSTPSTVQQSLQQQQCPDHQQAEQEQLETNPRRCLRYPDSPDSMEDSLEKRKSVASSIASTTSSSSSLSRCGSGKTASTIITFGTLDVTVAVQGHQVHVHVLRCKDLCRTNGGPINAYVKVALLTAAQSSDTRFQRTAVQRNSAEPLFEHRFVFKNSNAELAERIQLSVWHRDREYKRSEFLGCMSFPVDTLRTNAISGTYRLQSQSNLTHPTPAILLQPSVLTESATPERTPATIQPYSTNSAASSSSAASQPRASNSRRSSAISLSKKALHQRDADEHLFLRYLRLSTTNATEQSAASAAPGRTACTLSKRLTAAGPNRGFGFTVVWTHPPRVEKVEAGLSADRADVRPGDFLAFVGEHNVVTMPEVDVLNLIRAQGQTLDIEVFRKSVDGAASMPATKRPLPNYEDEASSVQKQRTKMARVEFCEEVGSGIVV